jgi:hypothetical protein
MPAGAGQKNGDDFSPAPEEPERPSGQDVGTPLSSDPRNSGEFAAELDVDPNRDDVKG